MLKIIAISLADSEHRRKAITEQFEAHDLDVEIFDAVDGRAGFPPAHDAMVNRADAAHNLGKVMTDSELCCALSHAYLCRKIANDPNISGAIIVEDDAILGPEFGSLVRSNALQKSSEDMVLLYHSRARVFKDHESHLFDNFSLRRPIGAPSGTVAYYVTRRGAQTIADRSLPISRMADWGFDISILDAKCIDPVIVRHPELLPEQSTIRANMEIERISLIAKLRNPTYRKYMVRKPFSERIS